MQEKHFFYNFLLTKSIFTQSLLQLNLKTINNATINSLISPFVKPKPLRDIPN